MADPIDAYKGRDRMLRDQIELIIYRATLGSVMPAGWRGTLYVANDIMALVKATNDASRYEAIPTD